MELGGWNGDQHRPLVPPIYESQKVQSPGVARMVWVAGVLWLSFPVSYHPPGLVGISSNFL